MRWRNGRIDESTAVFDEVDVVAATNNEHMNSRETESDAFVSG